MFGDHEAIRALLRAELGSLARIEARARRTEHMVCLLLRFIIGDTVMPFDLQPLIDEVAATEGAEASASVAFEKVLAELHAAASTGQVQAVADLVARLKVSREALAKAVAAAPVVEPAPAPAPVAEPAPAPVDPAPAPAPVPEPAPAPVEPAPAAPTA